MNSNNNLNILDEETKEMLQAFVSEAFDSLDTSEHLIEMLKINDNPEDVNTIFRVFHTIKGLSGFFGQKVINNLTHEAETLLDIIRRNLNPLSEDTLSIIYATYDFLRELLQQVSVEYTDIAGLDASEDMIFIIKDAICNLQNVKEVKPSNSEKTVDKIDNSSKSTEIHSLQNGSESIAKIKDTSETNDFEDNDDSLLSDDMFIQYFINCNDLIEVVSNNLIILEKDPENMNLIAESFGAIHSLKGNSGFMGFAEIEEIAMDTETILDSVRQKELLIDETIISILLSNVEIITNRLLVLQSGKKAVEKQPQPETKTTVQLPQTNAGEIEKLLQPAIKEEIMMVSPATVNIKTETKSITENIKAETKSIQEPEAAEEELHESEHTDLKTDVSDTKMQFQGLNKILRKDIRVETGKIDRLFDLVGELLTIESMVINNPDLKGLNIPQFYKSANMLNKITRELQEVTMSVRMMPLDGLFNKMKRLVRDVSIKMQKKVELTISGQETEMDKNVIDEIADPLVHILRNSIDHGIEKNEARLKSGKNETGKINLSAKYEGNEILIIIEDDGGGINRTQILNKAISKNLISSNAEKMTDKEVYALLFEPGFSTAEKITDISGRGVGLDVVKKNIEKLRGSVDVESSIGKGTKFILRIPLTLAIMESMVIRVSDNYYALPILSITESFRVDPKNISKTMDGLELVKVRKNLMPVIRLHELFNRIPKHYELEKGILIIVESRNKKVCLFVDEIVGQQQAVVKSLTDYIGKVSGVTGCMIMGDGSIGLILDIEGIINMSEVTSINLISA
jgi:two-component system chemotaxis sensor kinase CheA